MNKNMILFVGLVLLGVLAPRSARSQSVILDVGVGVGSGLELGGPPGAGGTVMHHSPIFLSMDVGFLFDNDRRFELGAALLLEVEGRVGVGIQPQLRINTSGKRVRGYVTGGIPIFFAPYTLYGVSIGPGVNVRVWHDLNLFGEVIFRAYPFGNDLPDNAALFHLDGLIGVRHGF